MSAEHRRGLLIPWTFNQHPKVINLPAGARYFFISILILAAQSHSDGRLTRDQVYSCAAGIRNVGREVDRLVDAELLRREAGGKIFVIVDPLTWITPGRSLSTYVAPKTHTSVTQQYPSSTTVVPDSSRIAHTALTDRSPIAHTTNGKTPAQGADEKPRAGPPARTIAPPRAGSFEVPSSTRTDGTPKDVRDAPRSGGGAARPARKTEPIQEVDVPAEGVTLTGAEARKLIRKQIANGQKKNPASTGRPTKFSKYDPDRPTEPIPPVLFGKADPK